MKKLLTQTIVLAVALAIGVSTLAQSPNNTTRQRRAEGDGTQSGNSAARIVNDNPLSASDNSVSTSDRPSSTSDMPSSASEKPSGTKKDNKNSLPEVTADAQNNRRDPNSEEEAIVPYYNNFFTTYRLGPDDVISVSVFGQERYSK